MNNQFATQFLLSEEDAYDSLRSMLAQLGAEEDSINVLVKAVEMGALKPSETVEIVKKALNIDETSAVGGGVTGGPTAATFSPGAGEQMAGKKAFEKVKEGTFEDEEVAIFDGGEDGITKIYKEADRSYYAINNEFDFVAKDKKEMLHKLSQYGYKHLSGNLDEDAPRLAGSPAKTTKQGAKNLSAYSSVGFKKAPSVEAAAKQIKGVEVKELWEGQRYSQFKKETATRSKAEQMHEAVKAIHKKLEEVSKLLEFTSKMKVEISESEYQMEYKHNTKKVFEKIHTKVVEVFSKVKKLN